MNEYLFRPSPWKRPPGESDFKLRGLDTVKRSI
jgi:hypothetical protein